jgi:hypothetical protein
MLAIGEIFTSIHSPILEFNFNKNHFLFAMASKFNRIMTHVGYGFN